VTEDWSKTKKRRQVLLLGHGTIVLRRIIWSERDNWSSSILHRSGWRC